MSNSNIFEHTLRDTSILPLKKLGIPGKAKPAFAPLEAKVDESVRSTRSGFFIFLRWFVLQDSTLHSFKKENDTEPPTESIDLRIFTSSSYCIFY